MFTNFVVAFTAGAILLDMAGLIDGVSYVWLGVMFIGWAFLKTAYELGSKKKQEEAQKEQMDSAFNKLMFALEAMKDSDKSEKH